MGTVDEIRLGMTKKILAGQIRELVNAIGGAVAAFGFVNQEIASASGGVLLSVLMLIWGIKDKEGFGVLASLVRKLIASAAGAALVLGWLDKEKFEALEFISAAVLPVVLGFSAKANGVKVIKGLPVLLFFAFLALALPSCGATIEYDLGPSFGGAVIGIEIPHQK